MSDAHVRQASVVGRGRSATPARARKRTRADADAGVREIVKMMTAGAWIAGQSHADIAFAHGVSPATVKDWATSASRVIRMATEGDLADVRARMLATLDTVVATAMGKKAYSSIDGDLVPYDAPDLKAAVSAIGEQAKLLGLTSTKIDVVNHRVAHLSKDEHAAELRKLQGDIADELAHLAKEKA